MDDTHTYHLLLRGAVALEDVEAAGPPGLAVEPAGPAATRLSLRADQAGLVGLIRSLHGLGFVLLEMRCLEAQPE